MAGFGLLFGTIVSDDQLKAVYYKLSKFINLIMPSKLRNLFQPPSLRRFVVLGLTLAIFPLLVALYSAVYSMDTLTRVSRITVYRAVNVTRQSQILLEKLNEMERSARQYFVLEDPVFFNAYELGHDEFVASIHGLMDLVGQDDLWRSMKELAAEEFEVYREMVLVEASIIDSGDLDEEEKYQPLYAKQDSISHRFKKLNKLVHGLAEQSASLVREEVNHLDSSFEELKKNIVAQSSVLLPISIFLFVVFVYLIIRPIRQLDKAIRGLGRGDFETPIQVRGTRDFEYLGGRLNWLRQRLKQLEEDKQRFLRNVSHELKTPLAAINEGIGLLADEVVGELNAEQTDIVGILDSSSTKLDNLIEDLLDFSQLQSQMGEFTRENIDLRRLLGAVIQEYQINLKANDINIILRVEPVKIYGITEKFRIIFDNLLSNAVKYCHKGGEIKISLTQQAESVQLDIEDDGPGIDIEERKKVFDLFYRGHRARKIGIKGSGLGLAIVNECIVVHHGSIEIKDPRAGKSGAFFRVTIPQDLRKVKR